MSDDSTVECPHCREEIYDDAEQCPYCRQYLSASDFEKRTPTWVVVLIALTIISFLLPTIFTLLRSIAGQ